MEQGICSWMNYVYLQHHTWRVLGYQRGSRVLLTSEPLNIEYYCYISFGARSLQTMAQFNTQSKAPGPLPLLCLSCFSPHKLARSPSFDFLFLSIFSAI